MQIREVPPVYPRSFDFARNDGMWSVKIIAESNSGRVLGWDYLFNKIGC